MNFNSNDEMKGEMRTMKNGETEKMEQKVRVEEERKKKEWKRKVGEHQSEYKVRWETF